MLEQSQKHWRSIFALIAIWLVFECAISWAAFCDPINYPTDQNAGQEYNCVLRGPVVSIVRFIYRGWTHIFDKPDAYVALFTAVLAFFTLALWRSTDKLWDAGERQLRLMETSREQQNLETRILQRAYISVEPGGVHQFRDGTDRLSCKIIVRNAGNLPAREVAWFIDRVISPQGNLAAFVIGPCAGNIILAPQVTAQMAGLHIPKQDVLRLKPTHERRDEHWIYVWGRVEYHDGFRPGRFINFCHRYNLAASDKNCQISEEAARYHEHGNSADTN
jgi:hypothetical protein